MAKISPVSAKYIIHATIEIEGVVDRPDVIGAIFGQTEGLLGADLELRELQRSGRIGRIEVKVDVAQGKSKGEIIIPSSLDKAETAIVAAALEVIQRIGPCNAKILVQRIEDVRIVKRQFVIQRAKELLRELTEGVLPDSQELADEVTHAVRVMEIQTWGPEKLDCGPAMEDSEEIIFVEGRADVLNLLKHGFKNGIAMNGTSVPNSLIPLTKSKEVTVFVDGDRGGDLIVKGMMSVADVDFVARAPDGKEVEELTKKEIHQALRGRVAASQASTEVSSRSHNYETSQQRDDRKAATFAKKPRPVIKQEEEAPRPAETFAKKSKLNDEEKAKFNGILADLTGSGNAALLNQKLDVLGKVPIEEVESTIKSLGSGVYAVVMDGSIERELAITAEKSKIKYLVGSTTKVRSAAAKLQIITSTDL